MNGYFRLARNMAMKSISRVRLGAVLVNRHKIISTGFNNMFKTHTIMNKYNTLPWSVGIHAEVAACIGVSAADLQGAEIYVHRIFKNGNTAMAKPCQTCQNFLKSVGVSKAYYTTNIGITGALEL